MKIKQRIELFLDDINIDKDKTLGFIDRVSYDLGDILEHNELKYSEDETAITNARELLNDFIFILRGYLNNEDYE